MSGLESTDHLEQAAKLGTDEMSGLGAGWAAAAAGAFGGEGVDVGPPSVFAKAVPTELIEPTATCRYLALIRQSAGRPQPGAER